MLSIGRTPGQYIVLGDEIVIQVVATTDGLLRLAIDAPKDLPIVRGENYELTHPIPSCIRKARSSDGKVLPYGEKKAAKG